MIDTDCERCRYNPIVMHALALLADCHDDLAEARNIAAIRWRYGRDNTKHWRQIYSVLNHEGPRA